MSEISVGSMTKSQALESGPGPQQSTVGHTSSQQTLFRFLVFIGLFLVGEAVVWYLGGRFWSFLYPAEKVLTAAAFLTVAAASLIVPGSIHIVEETERAVIYFLGRYRKWILFPYPPFFFRGVRGPGLFVRIPFFETIARRVDIRTKSVPFSAAQTQTKDQLSIDAAGETFYKVEPDNADRSVIEVEDLQGSIKALTELAAKDMIGGMVLDDVTSNKEAVAGNMEARMKDILASWGVKIVRVALTDVLLPVEIGQKISSAAEAKYDALGRLELAQMEKRIAEENLAAGKIYEQNPSAFAIRQMGALLEAMKSGKVTTFVLPSTMAESLGQMGSFLSPGGAKKE